MLLRRTLLFSLPDDVHLDRLRFEGLGGLGFLVLPAAPVQRELVLSDANKRRRTPEQENACGGAPRNPEHEHRHDDSYDERLVALLVLLVLHLLEHHGQERRACEDDHQHQVGKECEETFTERARGRLGQVGDDSVERERRVGGRVSLDVAKHLEQGNEDGHLQQHGEASHQRVELGLGVQLLHLLVHANLVVAILLLDLLDLGLDLLHLKVGLRLLVHQRRHEDAEDDRDDDDGQAPVMAEAIEEVDYLENGLKNDLPHINCPLLTMPRKDALLS